jgi:hypothetical protein
MKARIWGVDAGIKRAMTPLFSLWLCKLKLKNEKSKHAVLLNKNSFWHGLVRLLKTQRSLTPSPVTHFSHILLCVTLFFKNHPFW